METPTARIMKEDRFRFGAAQVLPYRYYYGAISPFSFLEIDGRFQEVVETGAAQTGLPAAYGTYKDKVIDLKLQVLKEGKWWPAMALGIMDPQGTRLYSSQYLVASKQFYPFDLTIGFGNGRYGKRPLPALGENIRVEMFQENGTWRSDGQFFWGVQFAASKHFVLMAEYSPIQYEKQHDAAVSSGKFPTAVPSKFNFGLRWKPLDWLETDISYQRGQEIGVNVSMAFDLGVPILPIYGKGYREKTEMRQSPLEKRVGYAMEALGFSNIGVKIDGEALWIEAQNDKYYYAPKALGMMLRGVAEVLGAPPVQRALPPPTPPPAGDNLKGSSLETRDSALIMHISQGPSQNNLPLPPPEGDKRQGKIATWPERPLAMTVQADGQLAMTQEHDAIRTIHLMLSENGIPMVAFTTTREDLGDYLEEKFTLNEFLRVSKTTTDGRENLKVKHTNRNWWDWGLKPSFQTLFNDPSGFFKYRFGAAGWVSVNPWRGGSFVAGLEGYAFNTISSANAPSAQAVRTDAWLYRKENVNMGLLMYEHIEKFPHEIYGKVAGGFLEVQYGGLDAELAKPLFNGRFMVGVSGSVVKKRSVDKVFQFKENDWKDTYQTAFLNTRLNLPELEAAIDLKSGQFLAGDKGTRVTFMKSFNGIVFSLWWSFTNTDLFTDSYNRGYHDKGISVSIPLRLFKGSDSRTAYSFGASPWTRDVAQDIDHFTNLFDYMGRKTKVYLEKDSRTKDKGFGF